MNEQLQGRIDGFAAVFCQHFYGYHNRSFDSSIRHHARCVLCLFHEERHVTQVAEVAVGADSDWISESDQRITVGRFRL